MTQNNIQIHCSYDELLSPKKIKPNKANRNKHSLEQIERLAKIIQYQGFRHPLVISKNSGLLVSGHGRLSAAKKLGLTEIPVKYQEFKDTDQENAFAISDNSIAAWAVLDLSGINEDLANLGPDFDIELLGIKDFVLDLSEHMEEDTKERTENIKFISCPHCHEEFEYKQAKKRDL